MKSLLSIEPVNADTFYHRYLESGERKSELVKFKPFCGVESAGAGSQIKSLFNKPLDLRTFDSMSEYRSWKKDNESYVDIHGDVRLEYMFLASKYQGEIPMQWEHMHIDNYDIEVYCPEGFPEADHADWPITTITIQNLIKKTYTVFGYKNYVNHRDDVEYVHCDDEKDLLKKYVAFVHEREVDVLTGWNIVNFDVPYTINRIKKLLGNEWAKRLSPIKKIKARNYRDNFDNEVNTYLICGTVIYDYMELYEKFQLEPRDGKSLEVIAQAELGKGKLDYKSKEKRSLVQLYDEDFQTYVDYNIEDTTLVGEIDNKRQYIRLAVNMTYMSKCLFPDVFGTVGIWDAYLYNTLLSSKVLCPPKKTNQKQKFPGGWVEEPERGLHGWNMVFDIASSYPNSIISYNISPECIIEFASLPQELQDLANSIKPSYNRADNSWLISDDIYDIDWIETHAKELLKQYDVCMTPWGEFFRRDKTGFIPEVVSYVFDSRKGVKNEMKSVDFSSEEYAAMNAKQGAFKVLMNSLYGAMSNIWFRYFDIRMAGSVTCCGQVSVKGSAKFLQDEIRGLKNKYTDTDSIFLDLQPFIDARFKGKKNNFVTEHDFCMKMSQVVIEPKLVEFFDRLTDGLNTKRNTLVMESEALADTWLIVEKKKYSMRIVNDEGEEMFDRATGKLGKWNYDKTEFKEGQVKLKTKGLTLIQSTTPAYARKRLKKSIELIFDTRDEQLVKSELKKWKEEFMTLPFEEIAMPRSVSTFNKYLQGASGAQAHVRSAIRFNEMLEESGLDKKYRKIHQGDKIRFAYLKEPNIFGTDVISCLDHFPTEWEGKTPVDWNKQWEKCVLSQLDKIFDKIGWNISEDTVSLEDFFD